MFLPLHRKVKAGVDEEDVFNDLREEVAELTIARRDCLRRGIRNNNLDSDTMKEAADVVLTAYGYLALISKNPNGVLRQVIADNIRRDKYDKETVQLITTHGGRVIGSLSEVLEDLRND